MEFTLQPQQEKQPVSLRVWISDQHPRRTSDRTPKRHEQHQSVCRNTDVNQTLDPFTGNKAARISKGLPQTLNSIPFKSFLKKRPLWCLQMWHFVNFQANPKDDQTKLEMKILPPGWGSFIQHFQTTAQLFNLFTKHFCNVAVVPTTFLV